MPLIKSHGGHGMSRCVTSRDGGHASCRILCRLRRPGRRMRQDSSIASGSNWSLLITNFSEIRTAELTDVDSDLHLIHPLECDDFKLYLDISVLYQQRIPTLRILLCSVRGFSLILHSDSMACFYALCQQRPPTGFRCRRDKLFPYLLKRNDLLFC